LFHRAFTLSGSFQANGLKQIIETMNDGSMSPIEHSFVLWEWTGQQQKAAKMPAVRERKFFHQLRNTRQI